MEQLCGEGADVCDMACTLAKNELAFFSDCLKQAADSGLGKVRYLNKLGKGD